jgi:hypothetical protein
MSAQMKLNEIEKRAFRSTYQDGLWDIYYGLIVLCMAFFLYYPESGYSFRNILLGMLSFLAAYGLFFAGKKWITAPRLGQVVFGEVRKRKRKTMGIVMGVLIALQAALVVVTATGWLNPAFGAKLNQFLGENNSTLLAVASVAMLMVGSGMLVMVHFTDFSRGYYIAVLMALAVFLMILFNRPLYPILIGVVIIVPGVVLLIRFLKRYPIPRSEETHE